MPRPLIGVAASGGFALPQWLALLGAVLLSICALLFKAFLCGSKTGGGKASASAQEMAERRAPAEATTTSCQEAPTPEIASRNADAASTATSGCCGPKESRSCCGCAGCRQSGPCVPDPCGCGPGAEGGDCCCCCAVDCGGCDCSGVDCGGGCDCSGVDCGGCDCGGCDCGGGACI